MRGWAVLLLCVLAARARAADPVKETSSYPEEKFLSIAAVAADKKAFHDREFCVAGKSSTIFKKYSRKGNHYYTVWLHEGGAKVKVFAFGFPDFKEGDLLEACGKFSLEKWVSGRVFYEELAARSVRKAESERAREAELAVSSAARKTGTPEDARRTLGAAGKCQ
ncbi:MAG: hypothetical protein AAB412_04080 [Elusimicrobiota bacterium]